MTKEELFHNIQLKSSFLCIGLDTDKRKIPAFLLKERNPIATFNKAIIEATHDLCVAYKPNIAFYESEGIHGWHALESTMAQIPSDIFTIADAKRGDIGNTSQMYAQAFFHHYHFDAVTVSPYMGGDSVMPFLSFSGKYVILLIATSNEGAGDFQTLLSGSKPIYEHVLDKALTWAGPDQLMFVTGATRPEILNKIRRKAPEYFFLVPGIGAQGGSLDEVCKYGMNKQCGLLVNSSRDILYAGHGKNFQEKARETALRIKEHMSILLTTL
ncbi:MAG TPA: orotidine-5'-phosphate decarboxylase [Saprospiraceae bacterium]|nr:orotidine-5'-phosphate decarboxylase [Saprospiraceae bacterium]